MNSSRLRIIVDTSHRLRFAREHLAMKDNVATANPNKTASFSVDFTVIFPKT
jgi:hypothetical protein